MRVVVIAFLLVCLSFLAQGQFRVFGEVQGENNQALQGVSVYVKGSNRGVVTDQYGRFDLKIRTDTLVDLVFTHIQYKPREQRFTQSDAYPVILSLEVQTTELEGVEIVTESTELEEIQSVVKIDAKTAKSLPSAFGDFNKILVTLPGVASNNELSSAYSVRGGNFDENLVYVNDIPVYRPFLANTGRQEGLSFVNPDMVQSIEFYAGGWEPKYGDKLSSSLNIEYKEPTRQQGGATIGLLGGSIYYGDQSGRVSHMTSIRHKDSRYLLNTLRTQGQYFPKFTDIQSMMTFDLSSKHSTYINKTKLNLLLSYGRNRYLTFPASLETQFGSVQANFQFQTAFVGREELDYDTYQAGFRLTHRFADKFRAHIIGSGLFTYEREQYDVEGAYRLCDVNINASSRMDECTVVRGLGTNYEYGRNALRATLMTMELRNEWLLSGLNTLEFGAGVSFQSIADDINEYTFVDSAGFIDVSGAIFNEIDLSSRQYYAYIQHTMVWGDSVHALVMGARANYWDLNEQWLFSPRMAYRLAPKWEQPTTFKLSVGYYQQPPFYRELRDFSGNINTNILAQRSIHYIAGMTRVFHMWNRPFLFNGDAYFKQLYDIIPYDIDNLRLRYHSANYAKGFATGFDLRVHGEFIKGTQSWFSFGFLNTQENLRGDTFLKYLNEKGEEVPASSLEIADTVRSNLGYVRRPTDQRLTLAINFEDHMPNDPSLKINLNLVIGSGYPFGPPQSVRYRNAFDGDEYYRLDIGLSKIFSRSHEKLFPTIVVRAEVLNAFGSDNTLSYVWIEDVAGNNFAVPNSLSARFLNIKLSVEL